MKRREFPAKTAKTRPGKSDLATIWRHRFGRVALELGVKRWGPTSASRRHLRHHFPSPETTILRPRRRSGRDRSPAMKTQGRVPADADQAEVYRRSAGVDITFSRHDGKPPTRAGSEKKEAPLVELRESYLKTTDRSLSPNSPFPFPIPHSPLIDSRFFP